MPANKILSIPSQFVPVAVGNLLNCAVTSMAGPVGVTLTQPYLVVKHIRISNKDTIAHVVTLFKGATGGSAAGTEFAFDNYSLAAGQSQDYFCQQRFDSTDFLSGIADLASKVTINIDAEVGFT